MAFLPNSANAQGCMPIRFVSSAVGGRGDAYLEEGSWRTSLAYRRLYANQFFIGKDHQPTLAPGGQPLIIHNNTVDLGISYAVNDRVMVTLNVPWTRASFSRVWPDKLRHGYDLTGFGDVNARASMWLWDQNSNPRGNASLGFGVRAPTGKTDHSGLIWRANGTTFEFPATVAIQPGEGGWGLIFQGEAFRYVGSRVFVYAGGAYNANPKEALDIPRGPGDSLMIGVPDTYNVRTGLSFNVLSRSALSPGSRTILSLNLGLRQDATTRKDLIGGKDLAFRAPAIVGYFDNGVSLVRGRHTVSISAPVRMYQSYRRSYADIALGRPGGGDLARNLLIVDFSRTY
jgi:hypothetical protein